VSANVRPLVSLADAPVPLLSHFSDDKLVAAQRAFVRESSESCESGALTCGSSETMYAGATANSAYVPGLGLGLG